VRHRDLPASEPQRLSREHVVARALLQHRRTQQAREDRHLRRTDRDHHREGRLAQDRGDRDRQQQVRNREDDVDDAHDERVDPAAERAGEQPEDHSSDEAEGGRDDTDQQRRLCTPDELGEHVSAEAVETQRELRQLAGPGDVRRSDVLRAGQSRLGVRREHRGENRHEHEQQDDAGADPGRGVAPDPAEHVVPEAAGPFLESGLADRDGVDDLAARRRWPLRGWERDGHDATPFRRTRRDITAPALSDR
jgi:hypothetical protein